MLSDGFGVFPLIMPNHVVGVTVTAVFKHPTPPGYREPLYVVPRQACFQSFSFRRYFGTLLLTLDLFVTWHRADVSALVSALSTAAACGSLQIGCPQFYSTEAYIPTLYVGQVLHGVVG